MSVTITSTAGTSNPLDVRGYTAARKGQNVFHPVIGRPDADVTLRPAALRSGTLTFLFESEADAAACVDLHAGAVVLTLVDDELPTVVMTYAVAGSVTSALDDDTLTVWTVAVDFQEVVAS